MKNPFTDRYLGWRMVAVAFFVDFVAVGFFFYSYGVFFKAIAVEFGGGRLGVSLGLTISAAVGAVVAPVVGFALDRLSLKWIMAAGSTFMAIGFACLSQVQTPTQFYLAIAFFIGIGANSMGSLTTAKLVTNWFNKRRGAALGIAATGISASGVFMPGISAAIIEAFGWRTGFMLYAAFTGLVVVPIVLRLVISTPGEAGLRSHGALRELGATLASKPVAQASAFRLLLDRNFWALVGTLGLLTCCQGGTLTHMVPRLTDAGHSLQQASLMLSLCAGFGVLGKLSFGFLGDRWPARRAFLLILCCQFSGQLAMFQTGLLPVFALGAALFGFGMGGTFPLQTNVVSRVFGTHRFGKTLGLMRPAMFPLQIIGVPLAGWIFDTTGTYTWAFVIFLAFYCLAGASIWQLRQADTDFDQRAPAA